MVAENVFWQGALIYANANVEQAINGLNNSALKILIVIDKKRRFLGTVSDGDIRRGILNNLTLQSSIESIIHKNAVVVSPELNRNSVLRIMTSRKVQQIPIVDKNGIIIGLHLWDELSSVPNRQNQMILMAGGKGTRLLPITEDCPKPMLKVAGKPILEHILRRAIAQGFSQFTISIGHLGRVIEEYFQDGKEFGVSISYLREKTPLGTAGALSLLQNQSNLPVLVTNGDVLTEINYGDLVDFHTSQTADATMATKVYEWQNPFGVIKTNGLEIVGYVEKPLVISNINAGIYVFNSEILSTLTNNSPIDMSLFFEGLIKKRKKVIAYPVHEQWFDIGRPEELREVSEKEINVT